MMLAAQLIHYFSIGLSTALTALGVSLGQGITSKAAFDALNRQPTAKDDITRATVLSLAIIETSGLFGFLGSILLFLYKPENFYSALATIGYALAIAIPGLIIGFASAMPAKSALLSIARQPFISKRIMNFMLLTQSLIQTPLAFGFIIALIIRNQLSSVATLEQSLALIASGLCIGLGALGPGLGVGYFTRSACESVGINRFSYGKLISFTIISQAIIETPVIFSAIIAFWLLSTNTAILENPLLAFAYLAVSFAMGIGSLGPGLSSGKVAASAAKQIAINSQHYGTLARTSMIAQGIIDTCAIYAFIISLSILLRIT